MIRTKYELIRRNENVSVEMDAEFEEDITHKFYNHNEIYNCFSRYKFNGFIDDFCDEYNCKVRCDSKYYLYILSETSCLFFGKFLVSTLDIANRGEPSFLALPSFDERGNPIQEINSILQNELYKQVKVCVAMEIKFFLFGSLDELTVYEPVEQRIGRDLTDYEREQLDDLHDEGSGDENEEEPTAFSRPVETPFIIDKCCICLTENQILSSFPVFINQYVFNAKKKEN